MFYFPFSFGLSLMLSNPGRLHSGTKQHPGKLQLGLGHPVHPPHPCTIPHPDATPLPSPHPVGSTTPSEKAAKER